MERLVSTAFYAAEGATITAESYEPAVSSHDAPDPTNKTTLELGARSYGR